MPNRKKDIRIMFCPRCNWTLHDAEDNEKTNRCPQCKTWTFEINQYYYYSNGKRIREKFELTDNDEISFGSDTWKTAEKVIDKAFKLLKREVKKSSSSTSKEKQ